MKTGYGIFGEGFTARNSTQVTTDPDPLPPPLELTHVTARAAAHFPMPPPPPLRVMVARPAQVTQVTQVPITLEHEPLHCVPCHRPPPPPMLWWHKGHRQDRCTSTIKHKHASTKHKTNSCQLQHTSQYHCSVAQDSGPQPNRPICRTSIYMPTCKLLAQPEAEWQCACSPKEPINKHNHHHHHHDVI